MTLITGDRVRILAAEGMTIQPGKGRTHMSFVSRQVGRHQIVVPADALPLIQSGRLDDRLFDVTAMLDFTTTTGAGICR